MPELTISEQLRDKLEKIINKFAEVMVEPGKSAEELVLAQNKAADALGRLMKDFVTHGVPLSRAARFLGREFEKIAKEMGVDIERAGVTRNDWIKAVEDITEKAMLVPVGLDKLGALLVDYFGLVKRGTALEAETQIISAALNKDRQDQAKKLLGYWFALGKGSSELLNKIRELGGEVDEFKDNILDGRESLEEWYKDFKKFPISEWFSELSPLISLFRTLGNVIKTAWPLAIVAVVNELDKFRAETNKLSLAYSSLFGNVQIGTRLFREIGLSIRNELEDRNKLYTMMKVLSLSGENVIKFMEDLASYNIPLRRLGSVSEALRESLYMQQAMHLSSTDVMKLFQLTLVRNVETLKGYGDTTSLVVGLTEGLRERYEDLTISSTQVAKWITEFGETTYKSGISLSLVDFLLKNFGEDLYNNIISMRDLASGFDILSRQAPEKIFGLVQMLGTTGGKLSEYLGLTIGQTLQKLFISPESNLSKIRDVTAENIEILKGVRDLAVQSGGDIADQKFIFMKYLQNLLGSFNNLPINIAIHTASKWFDLLSKDPDLSNKKLAEQLNQILEQGKEAAGTAEQRYKALIGIELATENILKFLSNLTSGNAWRVVFTIPPLKKLEEDISTITTGIGSLAEYLGLRKVSGVEKTIEEFERAYPVISKFHELFSRYSEEYSKIQDKQSEAALKAKQMMDLFSEKINEIVRGTERINFNILGSFRGT